MTFIPNGREQLMSKQLKQISDDANKWRKLEKMLAYCGKYQVSIQFWGDGNTNVYIEKDDVDLTDFGGYNPLEAIEKTLEYLNKINGIKS